MKDYCSYMEKQVSNAEVLAWTGEKLVSEMTYYVMT